MKPGLLPLPVHDGLKQAAILFPEAPGPVILLFCLPVDQQYLFIAQQTAMDHVHQQAEPGTTGTGYDVIISLFRIQNKKRKDSYSVSGA